MTQEKTKAYVRTCLGVPLLVVSFLCPCLLIYMNYTADEIGSIPFTCPSDYPYKVAAIRTACIIRSANIICMWSFILLAVLWITVDLYWDEDEGDDEEAIKNIQEELSRDNKA
ncbi:hypothetical protein C2G38_2137421 [Gigaspora rosea]|uniref:Uncharacterized protein n=1 Tax=Gigaspora rosea TaxID=44941 RepID=A0A397W7I7_9GLOM|nr:hypothetical protein C2G38_2137421 [Gigaspora rosea]